MGLTLKQLSSCGRGDGGDDLRPKIRANFASGMLAIEHAKIRKICCIDENAQFQEATPVGLQTWAPRLVLMPNVKPSRRHAPWKRMTLMPVDLRPKNDSGLRREEAAAVQHGKLRIRATARLSGRFGN
jgi:hypothetical protein